MYNNLFFKLMNQFNQIIAIVISVCTFVTISYSQTMNVHTNSGTTQFQLSGIDSITFSTTNQIPTDSLVAYYPFNGNANDESGNGNNGTMNGATLTTDRFGNPNKACLINGNSGTNGSNIYTSIPDVVNGLTNVTVSVWVKEYNLSYWHGEAYLSYGSAYSTGIGFFSIGHYAGAGGTSGEPRDSLFFYASNSAGPYYQLGISWDSSSFANAYQHYVLVYDGSHGTLKAYMNGNLIGSNTISATNLYTVDNHGALGKHWFTGGSSTRFNGEIDDVRIYERVLTDSEIQALYHENGWNGKRKEEK
jgi:hypothetical protein